MKTYKHHDCRGRHQSVHSLARCLFPSAFEVRGEGAYAVIATRCRVNMVWLSPDLGAATEAARRLDRQGCGFECCGRHGVAHLDLDNQSKSAWNW